MDVAGRIHADGMSPRDVEVLCAIYELAGHGGEFYSVDAWREWVRLGGDDNRLREGARRRMLEAHARGDTMTSKKRKRRTRAELDPKVLDRILTVLRVGGSKALAAAQAGVSHETLRQYEMRGEKALAIAPEARTSEEELFAGFYGDLLVAQGDMESSILDTLKRAMKDDWRAGAWLAEKLFPKRYGSRAELAVEHSGSIDSARDLSKLSDEDLLVLRDLRKKLTEGDDDG